MISDNASTDSTGEICREYATKDRRIKYFRNPVNVGLYENFRRVVTLATGEYFMWAAADDLKPPTAVEHCVQAILRNERAVTAHGIILVRTANGKESAEYLNEIQLTDTSAAARIRNFTYGLRQNAMFFCLHRRTALLQARLGSHVGQDYLLCLQMCLLGTIEYTPVPVIIYQERKQSPQHRSDVPRSTRDTESPLDRKQNLSKEVLDRIDLGMLLPGDQGTDSLDRTPESHSSPCHRLWFSLSLTLRKGNPVSAL